MRLHDLALASARVAIVSDKASDELRALLDKWLAKHLVKNVTLAGLRAMHNAGALSSLLEWLPTRGEADVIAILRKVDPHGVAILKRPRGDMEAHIRDLATGRIEPALDVEGIAKTIKLPKLRQLHDTGAVSSFLEGLVARNAAELIAVLRKVDPHKGDMVNRPKSDIDAHLRDLAAGRVEPAPKPRSPSRPRAPRKPKTPKEASTKVAHTGGIYERSRNLS